MIPGTKINIKYRGDWTQADLFLVLCSFLLFPNYAKAVDNDYKNDTFNVDRVYVYTSLFTKHVSPKPDHDDTQDMLGVELLMTNRWLCGLTTFDNSFGQNSEYLYIGYKWTMSDPDKFQNSNHYLKLTGGLLHGYKGQYEDKIPFNGLGVAPAIVPTYGYQYNNYVTEVILGGLSVVTISVGYIF